MKTEATNKKALVGKTLVIAEKPSVAQDIVRALTPLAGKFEKHDEYFESDTYVVSSAVGHLVEIQAPGGRRSSAITQRAIWILSAVARELKSRAQLKKRKRFLTAGLNF